MQSLSAPICESLNLPYLFNLECNHPIVPFYEKKMQSERHEVCLKYKVRAHGLRAEGH